ncbi:MAG: ArnT family glycosyltransferase, partial [bacterium]
MIAGREPQTNKNTELWKRLFWIVLGITTVIRLLYALKVPLTGDEAYFWEWSRHPALSYYDHPPLAGWILVITTAIFGSTVAGVRIFAVVAMSLVFIIIRQMTYEISGSWRMASLAGLLAMGIPLLEVGGILYSTDTPLILAGAFGGYFFYRAVEHGSNIAWWGLGICMGAAVMSKFLGVALPASYAGYLLLSPAHRHYLRRPGPYIAAAVTGLIFLPAIAWNAANGWATFVFNFSARLNTPGINLTDTLDYVIGQAVAMSPMVLFFAIPALYIFFPSRVKKENSFD